jgi:hypothetical protein
VVGSGYPDVAVARTPCCLCVATAVVQLHSSMPPAIDRNVVLSALKHAAAINRKQPKAKQLRAEE